MCGSRLVARVCGILRINSPSLPFFSDVLIASMGKKNWTDEQWTLTKNFLTDWLIVYDDPAHLVMSREYRGNKKSTHGISRGTYAATTLHFQAYDNGLLEIPFSIVRTIRNIECRVVGYAYSWCSYYLPYHHSHTRWCHTNGVNVRLIVGLQLITILLLV